MIRTPRSPRRGPRLTAALVTSLLALALTATAVSAQGTSPSASGGPDTPVSSGTMPPVSVEPSGDGATLAVPQTGLTDIRTQGWDHIDVAADGRTLTVYFWNGVDTCYGLAGVDVDTADGVVTVTLQLGTLPAVEACIEIAQLYKTIVVLDTPVIRGGLSE
jgi:hypothetical protein